MTGKVFITGANKGIGKQIAFRYNKCNKRIPRMKCPLSVFQPVNQIIGDLKAHMLM